MSSIEINECPICMEEISSSLNRVTTECGHVFHTNCLMTNAAHNGFGCPYCRSELAKQPVEDESSDEDYEEGVGIDYYDERTETRALQGVRNLFLVAEGGEPQDEESESESESESDDDENSAADVDVDGRPVLASNNPSPAFIARMLLSIGVTMEDMVKCALAEYHHEEYESEADEYEEGVSKIYGKMRRIITRHQRGVERE
ncbi:MAG: RING-H2 finger protein [Candidatus Paceibacterota bacterium]